MIEKTFRINYRATGSIKDEPHLVEIREWADENIIHPSSWEWDKFHHYDNLYIYFGVTIITDDPEIFSAFALKFSRALYSV